MELGRHDVVAPERSTEFNIAVSATGSTIFGVLGGTVIGVDEIDEAAVRNAVENRRCLFHADVVPAHVRHLEPLAILHHPGREAHHFAGNP